MTLLGSSRGNQYLMVAMEMDGNYINGKPLKIHEAGSLVKAYQAIMQHWKATGIVAPNWHVMDNKAPAELKKAIHENDCKLELTPPDMHHRIIAERAIQTTRIT